MRRLLVLSIVLLVLIGLVGWLVLPMFVSPDETVLGECDECLTLLSHAPRDATLVVIVPRGGTTLFELGRRIVPGPELSRLLPAPGLLAIGLGDAPVVGWRRADGRIGAAVAPRGPRAWLLRLATNRDGGSAFRWDSGLLFVGAENEGGEGADPGRFRRVSSSSGHFFAIHDLPSGSSVARLKPTSLEVVTHPESVASDPRVVAIHPTEAMLSLAVPRLEEAVRPIEKVLPVRTSEWADHGGQIIIYELDAKGLLPSIRGLIIINVAADPSDAIREMVPRVEGVTIDSSRSIEGVQVFRRETLGVVVDAATVDGGLAVAFGDSSMERWIRGERISDDVASSWSFRADPEALAQALDDLMGSPARHLVGSSARRSLGQLRELVAACRNSRSVRSMLVQGADGEEILSRVEW